MTPDVQLAQGLDRLSASRDVTVFSEFKLEDTRTRLLVADGYCSGSLLVNIESGAPKLKHIGKSCFQDPCVGGKP